MIKCDRISAKEKGKHEMPLMRTTSLGRITVNDSVIAREIIRSVSASSGKLFLSDRSGRLLTSHDRVSTGDLTGNFDIEESDDKYIITFYGIMSFGASIKDVTSAVLDALEKELRTMFPEHGGVLIIRITGVKSKNIAPRDIEIRREYESSR